MTNDNDSSSPAPSQKNDASYFFNQTGNGEESSFNVEEPLSSKNPHPIEIIENSSEESIVHIKIERFESFMGATDAGAENTPTSNFTSTKHLLVHSTGLNESAKLSDDNYISFNDSQGSNFIGVLEHTDSGLSLPSSKESDHCDQSDGRPISPWEEAVNNYDRIHASSSDESIVNIHLGRMEEHCQENFTQVRTLRIQDSDIDNDLIVSLNLSQPSEETRDADIILDVYLGNKPSKETQDSDIISIEKPTDPFLTETLSDDQSSKFISFDNESATTISRHKMPLQIDTLKPSQQVNIFRNKDVACDSSFMEYDLIEKNRTSNNYFDEKSSLPDGPKYFAPPNSPLSLPVTNKTQVPSYNLGAETNISSRVAPDGHYHESEELMTPYQNQMLMEKPAATTEPSLQFNQMHLIRIGAFGVLGGIFASSYAQSSCRFAISSLSVGSYQSELQSYAGLWKYSSMANTFSDYSSCTFYGGRNSINPPFASRDFGIIAFLTGFVALAILWRFLLIAKTTSTLWRIGVKLAAIAGVAQILTLYFFFEGFCRQNKCQMGSGSVFTIFAAISWFLVANIMHRNSPLLESSQLKGDRSLLRKISDFCELSFILERFGLLRPISEGSSASNKERGLVSTSRPPHYTVMV